MNHDPSKNPAAQEFDPATQIKKLPELEGGTIEELPPSDLDDAAGGASAWGAGSTTPTLIAVVHTT